MYAMSPEKEEYPMAYEYSFKNTRDFVGTAIFLARDETRIPATEEEEFLMEMGDYLLDGTFTEEDKKLLSECRSLDAFGEKTFELLKAKGVYVE